MSNVGRTARFAQVDAARAGAWLAGFLIVFAIGIARRDGTVQSADAPAAKAPAAVPNPDAEAKTQADMKKYTDALGGTDVSFDMVPIPGGEYLMGSPEGEPGRGEDESPTGEIAEQGTYESLMESVDIGLIAADLSGTVIGANKAAARWLSRGPRCPGQALLDVLSVDPGLAAFGAEALRHLRHSSRPGAVNLAADWTNCRQIVAKAVAEHPRSNFVRKGMVHGVQDRGGT